LTALDLMKVVTVGARESLIDVAYRERNQD
jgi:hypothetical protein